VKIYSEPGEGATLKLYLPRFAGAETSEIPAEVEPVPAQIGKETILAVVACAVDPAGSTGPTSQY